VGRPLWREDGSVFCMCRWLLPAQSFSVLVPWDLRPYFIVSEVSVRVRVILRLTVSQSVCLGVEPLLGLMTRYLFFIESYSPVLLLSLAANGLVLYSSGTDNAENKSRHSYLASPLACWVLPSNELYMSCCCVHISRDVYQPLSSNALTCHSIK
jgi:hypothetical protein